MTQTPIEFYNYDVPIRVTIVNDASLNLVMMNLETTVNVPFINGSGLEDVYIFDHLHFHWGNTSANGAEHLLNNWRGAGEIHSVHRNSKYTDISEAIKYTDGLAAFAYILTEVDDSDDSAVSFSPITEALQLISTPVSTPISVRLTSLNKYFGNYKQADQVFYRYYGSSTTPTCGEMILWTVYKEPIPVTKATLDEFRTQLYFSDGTQMVDNVRPVQATNNRTIYTNFNNSNSASAMKINLLSFCLVILTIALML